MDNDLISRSEILNAIEIEERANHTSYPKRSFTKRDIIALIKSVSAIDAENRDGCEYCQPNPNGEYTMLEFENPQNPEQHAIVSFYGGIFAVELNLDNATKPARISAEIKFCPFCGREL